MSNITDIIHEAMQLDEMAYDRSSLVKKVKSYSETIIEHAFKCLTLKNSTSNLEHWEEEIAEWLRKIDSFVWDTDKKLKYNDYKESLSSFYNSSVDNLFTRCGKLKEIVDGEYSTSVKYDRKLVSNLYDSLKYIIDESAKILEKKGSREREVFLKIVKDAIENKL